MPVPETRDVLETAVGGARRRMRADQPLDNGEAVDAASGALEVPVLTQARAGGCRRHME